MTNKTPIKIVSTITLISLLVVFIFSFSSFGLNDPKLNYSSHVMVYNVDYDKVIFEKGSTSKVFPAGTVKMMTALIALEHYEDTTKTITVTEKMLENLEGSGIGFEVGEVLKIEDVLAALIISNANDAALILAYDVAGSTSEFVKLMNEKAAELEMTDTRYFNVTGLHSGAQKTTCADILKLTKELTKHLKFKDIASCGTYTIDETNQCDLRTLRNRNIFISTYYNLYYYMPSVTGANFSYTSESGYCMSITAQNSEGLTYIIIVMNTRQPEDAAENQVCAADDAASLINWAFKNYTNFTIIGTGDMICEIPVKLNSNIDHVIALPKTKLTAFLPTDTDLSTAVTTEYHLDSDVLYAPIAKGETVGNMDVFVNGEKVGNIELVAKSNVDRSMSLFLLHKLGQFIKGPIFVLIIIAAILLIIGYIFLSYLKSKKRKNRVRFKDTKYK